MLNLLLPVIFPSWRFFSGIGPSPRIEFGFSRGANDPPQCWQEFRPQPERVTLLEGAWHLLFNPRWNEKLFINTCAERLFESYSPLREQEIMRRIMRALAAGEIVVESGARYLQYRISAVVRDGGQVVQPLMFVSTPVLIGSTP